MDQLNKEKISAFDLEQIQDVRIIIKAKDKHWSLVVVGNAEEARIERLAIALVLLDWKKHAIVNTALEDLDNTDAFKNFNSNYAIERFETRLMLYHVVKMSEQKMEQHPDIFSDRDKQRITNANQTITKYAQPSDTLRSDEDSVEDSQPFVITIDTRKLEILGIIKKIESYHKKKQVRTDWDQLIDLELKKLSKLLEL